MSSKGWFDAEVLPLAVFDAQLDPIAWFDRSFAGFDDPRRISQSFLSWFDSSAVSLAIFDPLLDPMAWFGDGGGPDDFPTLTALGLSIWAASPYAGSPFYNFASAGEWTRRLVSRSGVTAPAIGTSVNGRASSDYTAFAPTDLPSLQAWFLDGFDGTNWTSAVGGLTAVPDANGTGSPVATTINGNPAVTFSNASDQQLVFGLSTLSIVRKMTVFCVLKPATDFTSYHAALARTYNSWVMWFGSDYAVAPSGCAAFWGSDGTPVTGSAQIARSNLALDLGTTYVLIGVYDNGAMTLYVNGVAQSHTGSQAYGDLNVGSAGDQWTIGGGADGFGVTAPVFPYYGDLGNIGICNDALTGTDLANLSAYLNNWAGV